MPDLGRAHGRAVVDRHSTAAPSSATTARACGCCDARAAGSIALRREGGLLVALQSGVFLLGTEAPKVLVKPADHAAGLRFNDGRCDRSGRFLGSAPLKEPNSTRSACCTA